MKPEVVDVESLSDSGRKLKRHRGGPHRGPELRAETIWIRGDSSEEKEKEKEKEKRLRRRVKRLKQVHAASSSTSDEKELVPPIRRKAEKKPGQ